ncbi:MAG: cation:proton antiporter [Candidatus Nanopelagicales bacterium]
MTGAGITVVAGLIVLYALFGRRTLGWNLSAPMLAMVAGLAIFALVGREAIDLAAVHLLAEVTLVLVLFHDAATVRLRDLRRDWVLPVRLLAIGFPLALVATWGATWALLGSLGGVGALLLAAALTPTDAGLGAPTVLNPVVPVRVRRALNVESGLNDGLATPIVLASLAALATTPVPHDEQTFLDIGIKPLMIALVTALVVGLLLSRLLDSSEARGWSTGEGRRIVMLMAPLLLLGLSEVTGGNAFIAAFVGGLVLGGTSSTIHSDPETSSLLEVIADLLSLGVWFLAGGLLLVVFEVGLRWQWVVLAVAVLTVLRMVPVAVSLLGSGFRWPTVAFIGWFGPRGLASVIFALLTIEDLGTDHPVIPDVVGTVAVTVLLSVVAHGLSAAPLAARYGAWAKRTHAPIEVEPGGTEPGRQRGRLTSGATG